MLGREGALLTGALRTGAERAAELRLEDGRLELRMLEGADELRVEERMFVRVWLFALALARAALGLVVVMVRPRELDEAERVDVLELGDVVLGYVPWRNGL